MDDILSDRVGLLLSDLEGLIVIELVELADPDGVTVGGPVELAVIESDAIGLAVRELVGLADPVGDIDPVGLRERDPVGLTVRDSVGLREREPVGLGLREREPVGEREEEDDKGIRSYEIENIGSPFAFGAIGTAVGKTIDRVEFCSTVKLPVKSTSCH